MKVKVNQITNTLRFYCNGCGNSHVIDLFRWDFNGDIENPTVDPSIFVKGERQCHSFVREGKIMYLEDCWHILKGKTIEMDDL